VTNPPWAFGAALTGFANKSAKKTQITQTNLFDTIMSFSLFNEFYLHNCAL
jgi:hypothetical protein